MPESLLAGCAGWRLDCIDGELGRIVDVEPAPGGDEPAYLLVSRLEPAGPSLVAVHVSLVGPVDVAGRRLRVGAFRACLARLAEPIAASHARGGRDGYGLDHRPRSV
ncbi:MAG: hypothetical protein R3C15_20275 [Thermoleophilia bacterium]